MAGKRQTLFGLWLLLVWIMPAGAQVVTLEPSAAVRCLTPVPAQRGEPEYPFGAFKRGDKGRVKVELEFTSTDKRPAVKVLESEGDDNFIDAVKAHVREFRVPCMSAAEVPVRLVQEFVFQPDASRVSWTPLSDSADGGRRELLKCVRHVSGSKAPPYPFDARRRGVQGNVLTRLRFDSADSAPQAQVFARPVAQALADVVEEWAKGYRMPCHAGAPVEGVWSYQFRFEGDAFGFKPLTLLQLMKHVRGIDRQTLQLDTSTMACPFDLRLSYRQPSMPNAVGEVAVGNPSRRALLEWLSHIELDLPRQALDSVFGDTAFLFVPCMKIDLKPKEKS